MLAQRFLFVIFNGKEMFFKSAEEKSQIAAITNEYDDHDIIVMLFLAKNY